MTSESGRPSPAKPVRVCFISPLGYGVYRPESGYSFGGTEVQFYLLSRALAEDQAFQVSVLTTVPGAPGSERDGRLTLIRRQGKNRVTARPHEVFEVDEKVWLEVDPRQMAAIA